MRKIALILTLIALLLLGCAGSDSVTIEDAWARTGKAGENSAVYMVIKNGTSSDDQITGVESTAAGTVQLHKSSMDSSGTMRMEHQESIPLPASSSVEFAPGGLHVMLIGLTNDLNEGDSIALTLIFQNAGRMDVEAEVRAP